MITKSKENPQTRRRVKFTTTNNTTINEDDSMKILGFQLNKRTIQDTQLSAISTKVGRTMGKLRLAFAYLNEYTRKKLINTKGKPIALYGIERMIGPPQSSKKLKVSS